MKGTTVITGAGSGMGKCLCHYFARRGWKLCAADIVADTAEQTVSEISRFNSHIFPYQIDIRKPEQVKEMLQSCIDSFGSIDAFVNNAGVTDRSLNSILDIPYEMAMDIVSVNFFGTFNCLRECAAVMAERGRGNIVNITSLLGQRGHARQGTAVYGISKAAVEALTEYAALELLDSGININSAYPGTMVNTGFFQHLAASEREKLEKPTILNELIYILCCLDPGEITGRSFSYQNWKEERILQSLLHRHLGNERNERTV